MVPINNHICFDILHLVQNLNVPVMTENRDKETSPLSCITYSLCSAVNLWNHADFRLNWEPGSKCAYKQIILFDLSALNPILLFLLVSTLSWHLNILSSRRKLQEAGSNIWNYLKLLVLLALDYSLEIREYGSSQESSLRPEFTGMNYGLHWYFWFRRFLRVFQEWESFPSVSGISQNQLLIPQVGMKWGVRVW